MELLLKLANDGSTVVGGPTRIIMWVGQPGCQQFHYGTGFSIPKMGSCQHQLQPVPAGAFFFVRRILVFPIHQAETSSHLSPNLVTRVTDFLDLLMKK
jgi:hypothetical protein